MSTTEPAEFAKATATTLSNLDNPTWERLSKTLIAALEHVSAKIGYIPKIEVPREILELPIENWDFDLDLSVRVCNCLLNGKVKTIGDLLSKTAEDLLKLRSFGKTCLQDVREKLGAKGLALRGEPPYVKPSEPPSP
jgi:DNA-directed RNA polymerase alpha subunit